MRRHLAFAILAVTGCFAATLDAQAPLRARFLGNAAIEITDGDVTLLTDFPYRSGAFGHMTYDSAEIRVRPKSLCLFTHAHADHFEPKLLGKIGCTVVGPASVESRATGVKLVPLSATIRFPPLTITSVPTEHGTEPHDSYLVEWKKLRLYFTGDTDSAAELARQRPLDALFITPWLLGRALREHSLPRSGRIIICHHRNGERVEGCTACLVPRQGQTFELLPDRGAAGQR